MTYDAFLACMAIYHPIIALLVFTLIILLYDCPSDNRSNIVTGFFNPGKEKHMTLPKYSKVEL